ncbi:MAG: hypothetical protein OXC95_01110, partial [Dehalococcoidia bacterium]|nr:hypothetical protein [Dehalococcoidia bacterium]
MEGSLAHVAARNRPVTPALASPIPPAEGRAIDSLLVQLYIGGERQTLMSGKRFIARSGGQDDLHDSCHLILTVERCDPGPSLSAALSRYHSRKTSTGTGMANSVKPWARTCSARSGTRMGSVMPVR